MIRPSFEGTDARSLTSCVLTLNSVTVAKGLTRCTPSPSTCPVTRPNIVTTPTCPVWTHDVDDIAMTSAATTRTSMPRPRANVRGAIPPVCSIANGCCIWAALLRPAASVPHACFGQVICNLAGSLRAQRDDRIDACGTSRRQVARHERDAAEDRRDERVGCG